MHLTWYNSDTSEFFSPVDIKSLFLGEFDIVIILIDDVYDMFERLRGQGGLFSDTPFNRRASALAKLQFSGELSPEELETRRAHGELEIKHEGLMHLLAWRRAEMIQAENIALNLGVDLVLLGVKHSMKALELLTKDKSCPLAYLSHRITEVRSMNKSSAVPPDNLGEWPPVTHEVNELHRLLASNGTVIINPTAIDELRFFGPQSLVAESRYLSKRWPIDEPRLSIIGDAEMGDEYSGFFVHPKLQDGDSISSGIVRSAIDRIFFEIPFRDHFIVEHTPGLLVFRPFFTRDKGDALNADWSGGVRPEILHWARLKGTPSNRLQHRRAAFVHTDLEVRARLEWIHSRQERYQDQFTDTVQNHLRDWLAQEECDQKEIDALFRGKILGTPVSHLSLNPPKGFVQSRPQEVIDAIGAYALAALAAIFSMLPRPHLGNGEPEATFDVALLAVKENSDRKALGLESVSQQLCSFFMGQAHSKELNEDFFKMAEDCFLSVFGQSLENAAFEAVGVAKEALEALIEEQPVTPKA